MDPWYDPSLNPKEVKLTYDELSVSPHSATLRWEYVVPSNRWFWVELVTIKIVAQTASGNVGRVRGLLNIMDFEGNPDVDIWEPSLGDPTVAGSYINEKLQGFMLFPKQRLLGYTHDAPSGGVRDWNFTLKGIEFDIPRRRNP